MGQVSVTGTKWFLGYTFLLDISLLIKLWKDLRAVFVLKSSKSSRTSILHILSSFCIQKKYLAEKQGCLLKFFGDLEDHTCREDLHAVFSNHGEIKWIDFVRGAKEVRRVTLVFLNDEMLSR